MKGRFGWWDVHGNADEFPVQNIYIDILYVYIYMDGRMDGCTHLYTCAYVHIWKHIRIIYINMPISLRACIHKYVTRPKTYLGNMYHLCDVPIGKCSLCIIYLGKKNNEEQRAAISWNHLHLPNPISNEPPRPNNGFTIFLERIVLRDFVGVSCEATCWLGDVLDIKKGYKGFFKRQTSCFPLACWMQQGFRVFQAKIRE